MIGKLEEEFHQESSVENVMTTVQSTVDSLGTLFVEAMEARDDVTPNDNDAARHVKHR
jgi:hypothetical protein